MKGKLWAALRPWLGLALGGALLWFSLRDVAPGLPQALGQAHWLWVALTWASVLLCTLVGARRWQGLLRSAGVPLSFGRALAIYAVGQMGNALLPSRLGDLARAYLAGGTPSNALLALGTVVVEKALDGLVLVSMVVALALTVALPEWFRSAALLFVGVLAVLAVLVAAVTWGAGRLEGLVQRLPPRWRRAALGGLQGLGVLRRGGRLGAIGGLTLLLWLLSTATNLLLFRAFDLPLSLAAALLLLVTIYMGSLVRVVPGQLGVFHYLTIISLAVFGIVREAALPYALVLHLLVYGTIALFGAGGLWGLSLSWGALQRELAGAAQRLRSAS